MNDQSQPGPVTVAEHAGQGFKRVVESGGWAVGIKNHRPLGDIVNLTSLQRHLLSDEVFALLGGNGVLVIDRSPDQSGSDIGLIPMEQGKVYCIHKGVWHATLGSEDIKLMIVEDRATSKENSETYPLRPDQIASLTHEFQAKYASL
jgi:mannose-6-phosphate isomerase-like protein (cupin superfamily)